MTVTGPDEPSIERTIAALAEAFRVARKLERVKRIARKHG